jgi:nucleoid-associated protein YgaU
MASTVQQITVAGGNLYQIAAQYLGDPTQWNRIAQLNGLTDPFIIGTVTLKLPPVDASAANGGILGQ